MNSSPEHFDVLIVGAGLSGIGAVRYLQARCPRVSYAIFEARGAIGGTWDLFRYPGVRSDSDMFTLGYAFRPWQGAQAIAGGDAILRYITDTAAETGVDSRIRFGHRVVRASWSTDEARWHIVAHRTDTGETVEITCGFVFSCTGYYRYDHGYLPDFAGMDRFGGTIVHPQAWPSDLGYAGQIRHRHPFHTPVQPMGPAILHCARWRPVQGDQERQRLGSHRPHRHVHRAGPAAEVGHRA
jgi:cation diffusion facilitator CzcD-associated flavoprotein CzcO